MKNIISIIVLGVLAISCTSSETDNMAPERPSNIIFLIGDGMGLSAVSATFYFGDQQSQFQRFHHLGMIRTSSATHKVTDSAASGTAMAAGKKTYNGAVGLDTLKSPIKNITETVSELGWNTSVVSTSSVTHATPASFYAHVETRKMEEDIALQLLDSNIDFFAGGGINFFNQRKDGADLFKIADSKGFTMDTAALINPTALSADQKYGYLLAGVAMPSMLEGRGNFLPEATSLAIDYLSLHEEGFFLMVEGSQIDWAGHDNDADGLIEEVLDFQNAISVAMDFAEKNGNTLVVVTADHETGGATLAAWHDEETGVSDYSKIQPEFATDGHSATLIPVFAYGPGAKEFMGIYENTELFHKMAELARKGN